MGEVNKANPVFQSGGKCIFLAAAVSRRVFFGLRELERYRLDLGKEPVDDGKKSDKGENGDEVRGRQFWKLKRDVVTVTPCDKGKSDIFRSGKGAP